MIFDLSRICYTARHISDFSKIAKSGRGGPRLRDHILGLIFLDFMKVKSVHTILLKGKVKRFKGILGRRANTKKAIITLAPGNTIDLSVGV